MAGLKKPSNCECGSLRIHREYHPERWICTKCDIIISSRKRKAQTGICHECNAVKSEDVLFKPGKNQCINCYNEYMKKWNKSNRPSQLIKKRVYYKNNQPKIRAKSNKRTQSTWEKYLTDKLRSTKKTAKKRIGSDKERNLEFDIDLEFLLKLVKTQDGKCAITKVPMDHKWSKMTSASIDRIDSSVGYIESNIQLVCKSINLLKNTHSNAEVSQFLRMIKV